jgi:hypothetical protein
MTFRNCVLIGISSIFAAFSISTAAAGTLTGNLLTNPGAESGTAGWIFSGGSSIDAGTFDPGINPLTGSFDFIGGYGGSGISDSNTYQFDNIVTGGVTTTAINAGSLYADITFSEQGLNQGNPSDDARIVLQFYDSSNTEILPNPSSVGYVSPFYLVTPEVDSHGGLWTTYTESLVIPANTVTIAYDMQFLLHQGVNIDSFVDDNSLVIGDTFAAPTSTLDIPGSPSSTPEPSTFVLIGLGVLGFALLRRTRGLDRLKLSGGQI